MTEVTSLLPALMKLMNMSHGFKANVKTGWKNDVQGRERAYAAYDWRRLPEQISSVAERLRGVQIEHRDALELIHRFHDPKVLIYCDPPYVLDTRRGKQYQHEFTDDVWLAQGIHFQPGTIRTETRGSTVDELYSTETAVPV